MRPIEILFSFADDYTVGGLLLPESRFTSPYCVRAPPHHPVRRLGAKGYQRYLREQRDKERERKRKMEERRAAFKRRKLFATLCESSGREAALKYVPLENKLNGTNKALGDYKGDFDPEHLDPL